MGQWGENGKFKRGSTVITVITHVDTGPNPFSPIGPGSVLDWMRMINFSGSRDEATKMIAELIDKYVGRPYVEYIDLLNPPIDLGKLEEADEAAKAI